MNTSSPDMGAHFAHEVDLSAVLARLSHLEDTTSQLGAKVEKLEHEIDQLRRRSDQEIPFEILTVIAAAVSAYLGNRGKVKAVRFHRHRTWAMQGRTAAQTHHPQQT